MSFGYPQAFYLLLLTPVALLLFLIILRQVESVRAQLRFPALRRISRPSSRFRYFRLSAWFLAVSFCLIVALAEPQVEETREEPIYEKINLVWILDTSLSMRTQDIRPSRLAGAAEEIKNFVLHRTDNIGQMGLVTFAGSSMILSYLTSDPANILFYLDYLQSGVQPSFGTDIGAAINSGLTLLEKEQELNPNLLTKDFVFVLVSDGEDHGQALQQAVADAAGKGIRIYCLGLGSQLGGYIPIGERNGRTLFLMNEEGERVLATFDERALRGVAEATRASYYRSHSGSELERNLNEILWSERRVLGSETVTETTPLHYWFIASGFGLLAIFLID